MPTTLQTLAAILPSEIAFILWAAVTIWAIVDLLRGSASSHAKIIWAVIIVALPFAGPLAYFLLGRRPGEPRGSA